MQADKEKSALSDSNSQLGKRPERERRDHELFLWELKSSLEQEKGKFETALKERNHLFAAHC